MFSDQLGNDIDLEGDFEGINNKIRIYECNDPSEVIFLRIKSSAIFV